MLAVKRLARTSFARNHHADALQHLKRRAGALGQKRVGTDGPLEVLDAAAQDDGRHLGSHGFHSAHQLVAVHLRHQQVAQYQVYIPCSEYFESVGSRVGTQHAIPTRLQHKFANGKRLLVVIDAKDGLAWPHETSLLPRVTGSCCSGLLENRTLRAPSPGDVGRCRRQAPGYGKQSGLVRVWSGVPESNSHFANRGAAVVRAHRAPLRKEQRTEQAWLPAPLVWTWVRAYRQLHAGNAGLRPATTSFSRSLCFVSPWVVLDAAFSSGGCVHFRLSVYTCRSNRVCAHAEARPALTQVVSKRRKLHCRSLDNASRD